jgi:hypothetical protein
MQAKGQAKVRDAVRRRMGKEAEPQTRELMSHWLKPSSHHSRTIG